MNMEKIKEKVQTALKIREVMQNIFKKHDISTSYSTDGANPFYNQTDENEEGFICEYYYGSPSNIYTPLGYISIWESSMVGDEKCDRAIKEIEDTFGFVLNKKSYNNSMGTMGGWYHITKLPWNNTVLKCECKERSSKDYIDYDDAIKLYEQMTCAV